MERHRTLDSSMSSLYSGSNISQTPSRQLEPSSYHYPTSSAAPSPTPSGVGGGAGQLMPANGHNDTLGSGASNASASGLRATTIGTVVVRCGPIQLVIALLQSTEKLYIKVVELEPKITTLGANLDESIRLQKDHDETLRNIQNLPGPMDEFVHKADKLLASKRISSELVNAMADTLNIIWDDILHLLQDRHNILHICTEFHDKMAQCQQRMDQLEVACIDTMIPIEVVAVQEFLCKFKKLRIDMLTAVMAALKDGNELLAQLQELENMESLDTRPEHIKRDATRALHQVQQWLEALHDRRNALEIAWQTRKTQLEQCLALAMLGRELVEVEAALVQQRNEVNSMFSLGECEHTANIALQSYREFKQQALLLRDRALKITRAKEKLQSSGTFTGDEACARAYNVLSACTEHLDMVDQREHWLQQSREFFSKADNTLKVLEKLEVELSNVKLPPNTAESFAMYAKVHRDVNNFTEEPLRFGYSLLDEVGRTQPETQGIKRVLDEIENRKAYIEGICAHSNEDQRRVQQALNEFLAQYNDLLEWLMSSEQEYLQQNIHMGRNLEQSKQFLLLHHELMQDLEIKGELINLLLESIKTHLESLSAQQRYDVDSKAESLHKHWIQLKDLVLKRVDCVSALIEFFEKANDFNSQLEGLKQQLKQTPNEQKLTFLQETWKNIRCDFVNLKNLGTRFLQWKILDPYLNTKSSANAVEDILNGFSKQQIDVTTSLESWTTHIAEKREVETILEKMMSENEETATKTTRVDTQLYPIFTSSSVDAKQLHGMTQDKLKLVLQDIDQAQSEIQERVHTTLAIQTKDPESMQKIEQVISNLRTLKAKLDGIRYDYKTLVESVLQFLENVTKMRYEIDSYFVKQQQQYQQNSNEAIERCIAEHEKFRDLVMDKFRSLITQSELLIDRVRALEPPGAKEIDTDRILKLLENLRIYFETSNSERMSSLERLEKLEQFKHDVLDINRSLDSVCKQLQEINNQSVDSLAAAKTTSLAFEYFERTIELLEKRIEKFTETTTQQLLVSNPESEAYVREEIRKLNDKWQQFKEQVKSKRKSLDQATEFFEIIEKIDAEYHEISYFYNSVSNKITYLRDPVEASNLVNDIDRYVNEREAPLREKLDNAAKCSHDMSKVSQLYNEVMTIFQNFMKLKSDITIVQERLKHEERLKEQREKEAREQAERERIAREAEARERAAREEEARLQAIKEQAAREQFEREKRALELAARERAIREEEQRLIAAREQAAREQAALEQAALQAKQARLEALREEEARLQRVREEEQARLQALREEEARVLALREQTVRDEEFRLQQLREQNKREEEERQKALREQLKRDEETRRLQAVKDQIDHQRTITENIRKDVQINHIFTEIKYSSPQFTKQLKDAVTRENDSFNFECEVTGNPEPTVEWFKDGISIQNNPDYKTTFNKGLCRLVIEETFTADTARFTCRASNLVGNAETSASLAVRENASDVQMIAPRIIRFLESGKAKEGSSFEFFCTVTGNPLPTVQWYKNDKCIDDSPDYVISYNNGEAKLRFEEVFLEDDAVYTCSASNPAGIEHCSASLIVEPLEPTEMPHFKIPLTNAMARVGQKIKLEALIGGIPRPEIYWLHNGKPFNPRDIKYEYGRVTVIIPQAYPNDAGVYVLTAKNLAGEVYSSCNVNVKGRLPNETSDSEMASDMDVEPIKPSVQLALKDVSIFEGKPVRLDCVIVGQPEPEVIWYHNDRPVKESADVQLLFQGDKCSLIIQEVYQEDGGNYKVVAINSAGEASSCCELKVTPLNIAEPATRAQSERQSQAKELEPKFEKFLSDVLVDEGETVEMEVVTSGDKPMTAKWYLTNKELSNTDRLLIDSNPTGGAFKLTIRSVNNDDKGVYTVKVFNSAGEAKCFSHLNVKSVNVPESQRSQQVEIVEQKSCPEFKELFSDKTANIDDVVKFECIVKETIFPPVFGRRLQAQVVKKGEKIIMEVEVTGLPEPTVEWMKDEKPLSEAGLSAHRLLTQGNTHKLIIENGQVSDSGKYMVKATNAGGEAKSIADCAILEPTPERMQEVVKTIVYETPSEFKSETLSKEPESFETQKSEITTSNDLHGLSESKIITEHRCTTEATMRLEHKSAHLDLPELQQRPATTTTATTTTVPTTKTDIIQAMPLTAPTTATTLSQYLITSDNSSTTNQDVTDFSHQLEQLTKLSTNFDKMQTKIGYTQTPPPVPPKPHPPVTAASLSYPSEQYTNTSSTGTSTTATASSSEKKSSSFEYFKKIDEVIKERAPQEPSHYQKYEIKTEIQKGVKQPALNLEEEFTNLNLVPGSPPEICYTPRIEKLNKPTVNEKIKKMEQIQMQIREPPHGGVSIFPPQIPIKTNSMASNIPLATEKYSHDTMLTKSVKVEYGQPIMRPAGILPTPAQQCTRSPSPKPSAEGLAMSKLWTPNHVSGYESATTSEFEHHSDKHESKEMRIQKLTTPTQELSAPFLVQQASQSVTPKSRAKTPIDGIELKPGTPPEICFAGQPEQRRQSVVETMEKTIEHKLIQGGPSKVLPHSVPTITPTIISSKSAYKPPPPVVPNKLQTPRNGEYYESDYESDRWKYSGSESDENCKRQQPQKHYQPTPFKTNGYAADTEDISNYSKMQSSMMEKKSSYFESSSSSNGTGLHQQPPAQLYYTAIPTAPAKDKQESYASEENKYHHEDKDYKVTSMTKNIAYNMSTSSSSGPTKIQPTAAPSPIPVQRKTPAEFSDYSSEIDERFRSVSRNCESDAEIKGYRVVFPPTPVPKVNGHKSPVVVVTPSPMEFETIPAKPKFEPIRQEHHSRQELKTETKQKMYSYKQQMQQQQQTQQVFKPKPVAAKFLAAAQQQQQHQPLPQPQFKPQPQPQFSQQQQQLQQQASTIQPTMYYNAIAGTPLHMAKMATETKNVMQMKESSETCQRVVNMQQTKSVIHFDSQKQESSTHLQQQQQQPAPALEQFPFSPTPSPRQTTGKQRIPPPPTPTKFIPGDFRESDYDSEVENAKIAPLWTQMGERGPSGYRHVEPPRPGRSCSLPRGYERVLSPMEFDRGPEMPSKIQIDPNTIRQQRGATVISPSSRTQSLSRHSSIRTNQQNQYQSTLYEQQEQQQNFSRDDMNLKVGSPPRYGYIQSHAEQQAKSMSSTFMQKSHKFVEDVKDDLQKITKTSLVNGSSPPGFRPGFKRAPSEGDNKPQAYRDESRVSQYVPELPQDVPVNAHLNRDEYPQKPPMFITPLKDRAVVAGQQARFECIVQCHPQPNVMWNKNGYQLECSHKHVLEYRNGVCRLTIPQAYPDDAGTYSCSASNPLGTATTTGTLEVTGKYNAAHRF